MSVKPAYEMIKELITNRWNTKTQIKTDKNGTGCFKGFYGNYTLNITANGKTIQRKISLHSKGKNFRNSDLIFVILLHIFLNKNIE